MKEIKQITWEDVVKDETGTIYLDKFDEGIRILIMRGPSSICAYLGVPEDHPLAGKEYDSVPLHCHGGLTFSGSPDSTEKDKSPYPKGWYWYGWDYAHYDDYSTYDDKYPSAWINENRTKWTPQMVLEDSWSAIYDFKKLVRLAEQI